MRVEVENGSSRGGDEIVEFYVRYEGDAFEKPHHKLVGFKRGNVPGHEIAEFHYHIPEKALMSVMENGKSVLLDGAYTLFAGGCQPDERSVEPDPGRRRWPSPYRCRWKIQIGKEAECAPYVYPDQGDYAAHITKRKNSALTRLSPCSTTTRFPGGADGDDANDFQRAESLCRYDEGHEHEHSGYDVPGAGHVPPGVDGRAGATPGRAGLETSV